MVRLPHLLNKHWSDHRWWLTELAVGKGPIIRVTPYEVHIKDPDWFDTLYCAPGQGARDKYPPSAHMTGTPLGSELLDE